MVLSWAGGSTRRSASGAGLLGRASGGGWLQADGVAEGFELCDQAACFSLGIQAAGEVVGAELVVGLSGGQDMPDDDDHGVGDHDDRFLLRGGAAVAAPFHDVPVVEGFEVALMADRGPGALHQQGLQVLVAVAPPADSWLPGHSPVQEASRASVAKNSLTLTPISQITPAAASWPIPGTVASR